MNAGADLSGPQLAVVPSNPVPEGARVGFFQTPDRVRLRYAIFPRAAATPPRGTVCLVHGRTEFIEKYFETIADFQARGFAVATFDWRGQGGSQRLIRNAHLGHIRRFADYFTDLSSFHRSILLPDCPAPFYLVGHSMSGLVCLEAARRDRLMFERIFLSSPMIGLDHQLFGPVGMARLGRALKLLGLSHLPVGRRADAEVKPSGFATNPLTSDPRRYQRQIDILKANPQIAVGLPTLGWAAAAFAAMAEATADRYPGEIGIPVLLVAAANDKVVSTAATEMLGLRMRNGHHLVVPGGRHELLMESDAIRGQVLAAFDAFITHQSA